MAVCVSMSSVERERERKNVGVAGRTKNILHAKLFADDFFRFRRLILSLTSGKWKHVLNGPWRIKRVHPTFITINWMDCHCVDGIEKLRCALSMQTNEHSWPGCHMCVVRPCPSWRGTAEATANDLYACLLWFVCCRIFSFHLNEKIDWSGMHFHSRALRRHHCDADDVTNCSRIIIATRCDYDAAPINSPLSGANSLFEANFTLYFIGQWCRGFEQLLNREFSWNTRISGDRKLKTSQVSRRNIQILRAIS